jgi:hypothetical protein
VPDIANIIYWESVKIIQDNPSQIITLVDGALKLTKYVPYIFQLFNERKCREFKDGS